ncbi:MAG: DUF4118 domain-containing protein [Myxococcales bacterium]|nr:DUF4118 domain-containing protein [Myxococcales bacterium]
MPARTVMIRRGWIFVTILVIVITAIHYLTPVHFAETHTIFRRLYYFPIVFAAFLSGVRGGLSVAVLCSVLYAPHAFFMPHHLDPASTIDKIAEYLMFLAVGGLVGWLVQRERKAKAEQLYEAAERRAAEGQAQQLQTLVHLSRGLAHEVRNPLAGIQGAIEILSEEIASDSPRREMVDVALYETSRLDQVLSGFLDFARPNPATPEVFQLSSVVDHVVTLLRHDAEKAGVTLERPAGVDGTATGDPRQITQILMNLVRNAVTATPEGGRVWVRTIRCNKQGHHIIEVGDTGKGIPPEIRHSLFDPYVTGRPGGTGLGLFISSVLAHQNGATLSHRARPDGGTIFDLVIPQATIHPPQTDTLHKV